MVYLKQTGRLIMNAGSLASMQGAAEARENSNVEKQKTGRTAKALAEAPEHYTQTNFVSMLNFHHVTAQSILSA